MTSTSRKLPDSPDFNAPKPLALPDVKGLTLAEAAVAYAQAGIPVFPLKPQSKEPARPGGHNEATTDPKQVAAWWEAQPYSNIGSPPGKAGCVVADLDTEEAQDAWFALAGVTTAVTNTGSGHGAHPWYRSPELAERSHWRLGPEGEPLGAPALANLLFRGYGGYVVLAPSVHPVTGKEYSQRTTGAISDLPTDLAALLLTIEVRDGSGNFPVNRSDAQTWLTTYGHEETSLGGQAAIDTAIHTITEAPEGTRNDVLMQAVGRLLNEAYRWSINLDEAREQIREAYVSHVADTRRTAQANREVNQAFDYIATQRHWEGPPTEWAGKPFGFGEGSEGSEGSKPESGHPVSFADVTLPDEFWDARPELAQIRQAGFSTGIPADPLMAMVLTRLAADADHLLTIPAMVGSMTNLNLLVATVGWSGTTKSSSMTQAKLLLGAPERLEVGTDGVPPGSGEGLAELFLGPPTTVPGSTKKKRLMIRHNVWVISDEGNMVGSLANRQGNTLLDNLRSAFTGRELGSFAATADRHRFVQARAYSMGVVFALQPDAVDWLYAGEGLGTPQRFLFLSQDGWIPHPTDDGWPAWPGELVVPKIPEATKITHTESMLGEERIVLRYPDWVQTEVRERYYHRRQRPEPMDQHTDLIRLKVAGLLALLRGDLTVIDEDLALAQMVADTSRAVRSRLGGYRQEVKKAQERQYSQRLANRKLTEVATLEQHDTEKVARSLVRKVRDAGPGGLTFWAAAKKLSPKQRDHQDEGLAFAVARGWLVQETRPTRGGESTVLLLGPNEVPE